MFRLSITSLYVISSPAKLAIWSKVDKASRIPPSDFTAITFNASASAFIPSLAAMPCKCATMSSTPMRLKSKTWQREMMVGSIFCFSVVAKMKMAYDGGSSNVFKKALKAAVDSMCTSSMIYTQYLPIWGGMRTCSIRLRMSSTLLFEAASNSWMLNERPSSNARHDSQWPHASPSAPGFWQFMVLANIRAVVVFPTPREPQNK